MKQGIHQITMEEYVNDPCDEPSLSRSVIKSLLFECPAKAWFNHPKLNPAYEKETSDRLDLGTAGHSLFIEVEDNIEVIDADDWRKKDVKTKRDQLRAEGKTVLLTKQYEDAKLMVDVAKVSLRASELKINDLRAEGKTEQTYIWKEGNVWLRARLDWFRDNPHDVILDYKTTSESANPDTFERIMVNTGLDIQCALYRRAVKAVEGIDARFYLFVQEVEKPYLCSLIGFTPEFIKLGEDKVDYGIFLWKQCMESGIWPGYPTRIAYVDPPAWSLAHFESIAERIGE